MNINLLVSASDTIDSNSFITPWTFIHFLTGYISAIGIMKCFNASFKTTFIILLILHTIYEIQDLKCYFLKKTNIKTDCDKLEWSNNSLYNSIFDTIFFIFGILLVLEINTKNNCYLIILTILYFTILNFFLFYEYG